MFLSFLLIVYCPFGLTFLLLYWRIVRFRALFGPKSGLKQFFGFGPKISARLQLCSHNQCTACYNSFIGNACVICTACCERVHLSCCDALNDLGLIDSLCCKRCTNNKPCSIPLDLRNKCDSDHGIPSANMQAPSNPLTSRFMQQHLDIDSFNQENSS